MIVEAYPQRDVRERRTHLDIGASDIDDDNLRVVRNQLMKLADRYLLRSALRLGQVVKPLLFVGHSVWGGTVYKGGRGGFNG